MVTTTVTTITLNSELHREFTEYSKKNMQPKSTIINMLVREFLNSKKPQKLGVNEA